MWLFDVANERAIGAGGRAFPQDAGAGRRQVLRHHLRKIRIPQRPVSLLLHIAGIHYTKCPANASRNARQSSTFEIQIDD